MNNVKSKKKLNIEKQRKDTNVLRKKEGKMISAQVWGK